MVERTELLVVDHVLHHGHAESGANRTPTEQHARRPRSRSWTKTLVLHVAVYVARDCWLFIELEV